MKTTKEPQPVRPVSDLYIDALSALTRTSKTPSPHEWTFRNDIYGWMPSSSGSTQLLMEEASEQLDEWSPVRDANVIVGGLFDASIVGKLLQNRMQEQLASNWFAPEIHELANQARQLIQAAQHIFEKVEERAQRPDTVCVPIRSFAPEPFEVLVPIDVLISPEEDGFQAAFLEMNLHAFGESREEAYQNIKSVILEAYQRLRDFPDNRLGRSMRRQKVLLNHHLREASAI